MKRKKFVKQCMAMGLQRNTATAAADAASRAEASLRVVYGRIQTMQRVFVRNNDWMVWHPHARKVFDGLVLGQAERTMRRIRPLRRKKRGNHDGLRIKFSMVDEWDGLNSEKLHDQAVAACAGGAAV